MITYISKLLCLFWFFYLQGQALPGVSSTKQYPSSGPGGRNQVPNRVTSGTVAGELAEGATLESLIGRRVRTRWPDDNNFYEAVITAYNPIDVLATT
jgi:hypothetical protein